MIGGGGGVGGWLAVAVAGWLAAINADTGRIADRSRARQADYGGWGMIPLVLASAVPAARC